MNMEDYSAFLQSDSSLLKRLDIQNSYTIKFAIQAYIHNLPQEEAFLINELDRVAPLVADPPLCNPFKIPQFILS